jgi:hypothetical protein
MVLFKNVRYFEDLDKIENVTNPADQDAQDKKMRVVQNISQKNVATVLTFLNGYLISDTISLFFIFKATCLNENFATIGEHEVSIIMGVFMFSLLVYIWRLLTIYIREYFGLIVIIMGSFINLVFLVGLYTYLLMRRRVSTIKNSYDYLETVIQLLLVHVFTDILSHILMILFAFNEMKRGRHIK